MSNNSLYLMYNRLDTTDDSITSISGIEGVNNLNYRLKFAGGAPQQDRMILDKRRSLDRAVKYSYQGAFVRKYIPETIDGNDNSIVRALINPDKLKYDYDDKIISIRYDYNFQVGDIFEWVNTNTHWLIYLQDTTELAYFRGNIRKCSYEIKWEEDGKIFSTFAAVRGPTETKIDSGTKHDIVLNEPNYSLSILMPSNDYILKQFQRYSKFYLQTNDINSQVCWRVEATDSISTPGIIKITAIEYYSNQFEDDIEKGLVGNLIIKPVDPNPEEINNLIKGETFIKPKKSYEYEFIGDAEGQWSVDKEGIELEIDNNKIKIKWLSNYSGQFDLKYGDYSKTVVVESLF